MSDVKLHEGPAHLGGAKADLHRLFVALIKLALVDGADDAAAWRMEALDAQRQVAAASTALEVLHVDGLWVTAIRTAESDPVVRRDETVNPILPTMSPVRLQDLATVPFKLEDTVQTIRDAASFG